MWSFTNRKPHISTTDNSHNVQSTKWKYIIAASIGVASLSFIAYIAFKSSKRKKSRQGIFEIQFQNNVFLHLTMKSMEGYGAYLAADTNNLNIDLLYGGQIMQINDTNVSKMKFKDIMEMLTKARKEQPPAVITFLRHPELDEQWSAALQLKEEANALFRQGLFKEAIAKTTEAINLHPTNKIFYTNRVLMYIKIKQYQNALTDCDTVSTLDPLSKYLKGIYLRGLTLFNMHQYMLATETFLKVVTKNPTYGPAKKRVIRCEECMQQFAVLLNYQIYSIQMKEWNNYDLLLSGYTRYCERYIPQEINHVILKFYYQTPQYERGMMEKINFCINRENKKNEVYCNAMPQKWLNEWILFTNYDNFMGQCDVKNLHLRDVMRPNHINLCNIDYEMVPNNMLKYWLNNEEWELFCNWYGISYQDLYENEYTSVQ